MRKSILLTSILLIAALVSSGCTAKSTSSAPTSTSNVFSEKPKSDTIRIGYPDSGKSFPGNAIGIAQQKGFLEEEFKKIGVKIQLIGFVGAGPAINEALASKSIDAGIYGDTPSLVAKSNGVDTTLVGVGTSYLGASFVVPYDSKITSVKELKGKKVATTKGSYMHKTLVEALKANGLTINDIQFLNMTGPEADAALVSKQIDAVVEGDSSAVKNSQAKNGKVILDCKNNPGWAGKNLLTVRTDYAKDNAQTVVALLKTLIKGQKYADANPEEAKQLWTKGGVPKSVFDAIYPDNTFYLSPNLSKDVVSSITDTAKFLKNNSLIKNDVDIEKWIDTSYYQEAIK